jgi:hypothetical protein
MRRLPDLLAPGGHARGVPELAEAGDVAFLQDQMQALAPQSEHFEQRLTNPPEFADSSTRALR